MSDYIDRQEAISAIQKEYADTDEGTDKCAIWKNVGLTCALHLIQDLPSAERQGRWVAHDGEYEYALQNIADMFDPPCCYSYNSQDGADFMLEHAEGFCEECDYHTYAECWRKYFEVLRQMEATK